MSSSADPTPSSLQAQLDEITANTRALVPADRLAGTERLVAELHATGLEQQMLQAGAHAPKFKLTGANGKHIASSDLLALGPLVIKFFRGRWDPYDMTELEAWQALQPVLRLRRALLVAVSPQNVRQNAFTADRHHLSFPLLSDPTCTVARRFGLAYTVPEPAQAHFRSMLVNIPFLNGDESWNLPLPATYVLSPQGEVLYARAFADHRLRPDPEQALAALEAQWLRSEEQR